MSPTQYSPRKTTPKVWLLLGLVLVLLGAFAGLYQYQDYQNQKQQKLQQLIQQQNQMNDEQRAALGDLPEQVVTEESQEKLLHKPLTPQPVQVQPQPVAAAQTAFQCDGREHCSQMRSYEEAVFFIKNCPNTKMDGDNDGIPCERQFNR